MAKITPDGKHIEGLDAHLYKIVNGKLVKKTQADMDAEAAERKREEARQQRAAAYPLIGDQLDAIWKQLNSLRLRGENLVLDADVILNEILAVKRKYPKQEEKDVADD